MRKVLLTCLSMLVLMGMAKSKKQVVETWPDGTPMDAWFQQATKVDVNTLGKQYVFQGKCTRMLYIHPWSQFFKPGDRKDMPLSRCNNITMRNIQVESQNMFDVQASEKYELIDFTYDGKPLNF